MKAQQAAFIAVAVVFRTSALAAILFGLFAAVMPLAFGARVSLELAGGILRMSALYAVAGLVLWAIAKPAASLVVRGLHNDRRFDLDDYREQ